MPVHVEWDNPEHTVIREDFIDPWTWEDYLVAASQDDEFIDSVDHTVHLMLNLTQTKSIPPNPFGYLQSVGADLSPNLGLILIVGGSMWAETIVNLFYKLYGSRSEGLMGVYSVDTREEAYELIADHEA